MGLWFLSTLLFAIFSGLYFVYDKDRLTPSDDYQTAIAGSFNLCRQAALREALKTGTFSQLVMPCNTTSFPSNDTGITGLNVPGVYVLNKTATINGNAQRVLVTFIQNGTGVFGNGTSTGLPFIEAARQIREVFGRESNTGTLVTESGANGNVMKIDNGQDLTLALAAFWPTVSPSEISQGSIVSVQTLAP